MVGEDFGMRLQVPRIDIPSPSVLFFTLLLATT